MFALIDLILTLLPLLLLFTLGAVYYSGKAAVITINAVSHDAATWSMTISVEAVDVTNFLSSGCVENVAGLASMEITVSGPYTSVTALTVGASVTVAPEVVTGTGFTTTVAGSGGTGVIICALLDGLYARAIQ